MPINIKIPVGHLGATSIGLPFSGGATISLNDDLNVTLKVIQEDTINFVPHTIYADTAYTGGIYNREDMSSFGDKSVTKSADLAMRHAYSYLETGDTGAHKNTRLYDPAHGSKATAKGFFAAHTYDTPGTYTVRSRVFEPNGSTGVSADQTITVVDPTVYFTAAQTIIVSPTLNTTGAPHDGDPLLNVVATAEEARTLLRTTIGGAGNVRICFENGVTHDCSNMLNWFDIQRSTGNAVLFDVYGTGYPATLDAQNFTAAVEFIYHTGTAISFKMNGLKILGSWLSQYSTPSNPASYDLRVLYTTNTGPQRLRFNVFHDLHIEGFNMFCNHVSNSSISSYLDEDRYFASYSDVLFQSQGDYMQLGGGENEGLLVIGCELRPHPDQETGSIARNSHAATNYGTNSHNAFRGLWTIVYSKANGFAENHGWSGSLAGASYVAGQQVWRLSNEGRARIIHTDSIFESSGLGLFGFRPNNDPGYMDNSWVHGCMIIASPIHIDNASMIGGATPTATITDCLFVVPDTPAINETDFPTRNFARFIGSDPATPLIGAIKSHNTHSGEWAAITIGDKDHTGASFDPDFDTATIRVQNSGLIYLRSAANTSATSVKFIQQNPTDPYAVEEFNNFIYAPGVDTPINSGIVLDTTSLGFDSEMGGLSWNWEHAEGTIASAVAPTGSFTLLYPQDWYSNATSAADYAQHINRHTLILSPTDRYTQWDDPTWYGAQNMTYDGIDVSFGATEITVTNTSTDTWAAGSPFHLRLDRGQGMMVRDNIHKVPAGSLAKYDIPANIALDSPTEGRSLVDIRGNPRALHANGVNDSAGPWVI